MTHTLLFYDPGHFHAALCLSRLNCRIDRTIHVYAPAGPDVETFIALIEGFNSREEAPTDWRLECHIGGEPLDAMITDRRGEIVVLAGRNGPRLALMHRLHDEGFHVLADKPWLTDGAALAHLDAITGGPPLAVDIMTGRQSAMARLRNTIIGTPSIFGALDGGADQPALQFTSRHHLLKHVGGQPLKRPPWFYDVTMQGDGLVDIQSHYVDQAQWIIAEDRRFDTDRDIEILHAERWTTPVPLNLFRQSTGASGFPDDLSEVVEGDLLHLACNGQIEYRICGVQVRQHCEWGLRESEGGGDIHGFTAHGENAVLTVHQGPETDFQPEMRLRLDNQRNVKAAQERWRADFPGLEIIRADGGYRLTLPASA